MAAPSPGRRPGLTIGRLMGGVAALAFVVWLAAYHTAAFFLLAFAVLQVGTIILTRPRELREARADGLSPRGIRFSVRHMAATTLVVACAIIARTDLFAGALSFGLLALFMLSLVASARPGSRKDG